MPPAKFLTRGRLTRDRGWIFTTSELDGWGIIRAERWGRRAAWIAFGRLGDVGKVHRLIVNTRYRRRGLGTMLMAMAEAAFIAQGCTRMELDCRVGNAEGEGLYVRLGFVGVMDAEGYCWRFSKKI